VTGQLASFTVPIVDRQFAELDILLATLPEQRITEIDIDYQRGEVMLVIGNPPLNPRILRDAMLNNTLDALQALADYDTDCVCKEEQTCPTCRAAFLAQVYCWARKHIA
jgi:hypothetical protein